MRRRRHEEHVNHERWAIPYGDLITLLLAFFVVMYAMSAVNEGKYRVMSQSIMQAFHGTSQVLAPVHGGPGVPNAAAPGINPPAHNAGSSLAPIQLQHPATAKVPTPAGLEQQNLGRIQGQVEEALQPLIEKKLVVLRRTPNWLEIEIRTDILFPSGVAQVAAKAESVLDRLALILAPFSNPLRVEGYTDNQPIRTALYPSNWELSAARAASVARLFAEHGVSPARLGIMGWGEVRPIADNATAEGRNRNRRVLVVVLSDRDAPSRFTSDPEHLSAPSGESSATAGADTRDHITAVAPPSTAFADGRAGTSPGHRANASTVHPPVTESAP